MKTLKKWRFVPSLLKLLLIVMMLLVGMMAVPSMLMAEATAPDLGAASSFSVLAALSMSATVPAPGTIICGDLGLSTNDATSRTGTWLIGGAEYFGPLTLAATAHTDALGAFNNLAGQASNGGWGVSPWSPPPGVWNVALDTTFTGTITLNGGYDDVWVFQVGQDMTFSGSVVLEGNVQACHVFWQIGRDTTIASGSSFAGTLIASRDITLVSGATVNGRIISLNSSLTTDGNTVSCPTCVAAPAGPSVYTITASTEGNGSMTLGNGKPAGVFSIASGQSIDYIMKPNEGASIVDVLVNGVSVGAVPYYVFLNVTSNQTIHAIFSVPTTTTAPEETTTTAQETATAETTTTTPAPVTTIVTGGQIPKTSTPWYNVLVVGVALTLIGAVGWLIIRKRAR